MNFILKFCIDILLYNNDKSFVIQAHSPVFVKVQTERKRNVLHIMSFKPYYKDTIRDKYLISLFNGSPNGGSPNGEPLSFFIDSSKALFDFLNYLPC